MNTLNGKLQEAVAALARDHERAVSERSDAIRVLDESRSQIAALRHAIDEERLRATSAAVSSPSQGGDSMQSSLLGEIELALENRIQKVSHPFSEQTEGIAAGSSANSSTSNGERGAVLRSELPADTQSSQEYFFLAAAAIKIALAIKHPEYESEWIFRLQVPEAFERAMRAHVPFHEWYPWLYNSFSQSLKERLRQRQLQNQLANTVPRVTPPPTPPITPASAPLSSADTSVGKVPAAPKEVELRSYVSLQQEQPLVEGDRKAPGFFSLLKKIATEY